MVLGSQNPYPEPQGSFKYPVAPPDVDPDEGDMVVMCFSEAWLPYVYGALQQLTLQASWKTDDVDIELTLNRAQQLLDMFNQNATLCPDLMVIKDLRYNDGTNAVEQTFDGGDTWIPVPQFDPRSSTIFQYPLLDVEDPRCQAAANIVKFIQTLVENTLFNLALGFDAAGLGFTLLPLFVALGPYSLLIDLVLALAFGLFSAGATAISGAFTVEVYEQLLCIFYCNLLPDGSANSFTVSDIDAQIGTEIGGLASATMSAMLFLMGPVGVTNAGTQGEAPADCDECTDCVWCVEFDFTESSWGWSTISTGGGGGTSYAAGAGFIAQNPSAGGNGIIANARLTFASTYIVDIRTFTMGTGRTDLTKPVYAYSWINNNSGTISITGTAVGNNVIVENLDAVNANCTQIDILSQNERINISTPGQGISYVRKVRIRGMGDNPFDPAAICT